MLAAVCSLYYHIKSYCERSDLVVAAFLITKMSEGRYFSKLYGIKPNACLTAVTWVVTQCSRGSVAWRL